MKRLQKLKKKLSKIKGNIILSCTPGYDFYFEEFAKNCWRINIMAEMDSLPLQKFIEIKEFVKKLYPDYNLIISVKRNNAMEYWTGIYQKEKNLLLHLVPISSNEIKTKDINLVPYFIKKEIISGKDFSKGLMLEKYNWTNFFDVLDKDYVPAYLFFKEEIDEKIKIGMIKSYFMTFICAAMYCKGRIPTDKNRIIAFYHEKFKDKKMTDIIENFYKNKYKNFDDAVRNVFYFSDKLFNWPGLNVVDY